MISFPLKTPDEASGGLTRRAGRLCDLAHARRARRGSRAAHAGARPGMAPALEMGIDVARARRSLSSSTSREVTVMRTLAILCIVAAALTSSIAANAEGAKGKGG